MFKIGEKVVCVNDDQFNSNPVGLLKKGEIYTIESVIELWGSICVYLKEIKAPNTGHYNIVRFRKLDHTFAEEVTARIEEEINQENLVEA